MREVHLGAIAIVVGIALAVTFVWWVAPHPAPASCGGSASGNTPLGTSWAIGPPHEQTIGPDHWYNFSIQSAGGGLELRNMGSFQVQTSTGSFVPPGPAWTLTVRGIGGGPVGAYALTGPGAGNWSSGGDALFLSGQTIVLFATPQNLSGDTMTIYGTGVVSNGCPFEGAISITIP